MFNFLKPFFCRTVWCEEEPVNLQICSETDPLCVGYVPDEDGASETATPKPKAETLDTAERSSHLCTEHKKVKEVKPEKSCPEPELRRMPEIQPEPEVEYFDLESFGGLHNACVLRQHYLRSMLPTSETKEERRLLKRQIALITMVLKGPQECDY
ncbi:hypothetical protein B0T16DRAFT_457482 [Cercophora newfieldiana]|uniref:Uncharacterized protein n=1 Tax=Cercophora newfieldiana TaxID=92897 RepID=A0AA39Y3Q5_9PEZI|nr:hypothetical protein B0T16DRAFT_457482 [Cercophora newfieldiana]